ncbi:MAG: hypothetical protein ABIH63_04275 [archaeon]
MRPKSFLLFIFLSFCACATIPEDYSIQCIKGNVVVMAPHTVEARNSYLGKEGPVWAWETTFVENSEVIGVTITHRELKIQVPDGSVWENIDPVTKKPLGKVPLSIRVNPGGVKNYKFWCYDTSHRMCNSICSLTFYGVDDTGKQLVLPTMIFFSHKGCQKRIR